ncbi:MAG: 50S ribosomal protein L10 [Gammaproteobacteria bacterium]|jgi:large subunit ribosomal protein L10|nr:50S ribosomal protein L10 [Gammaproteobacteria bacterium]MBK80699.1 50S ribosomal protein L10 [Gammaproteobacteria bacterium]|tara:strand:+ start:2932 stop:3462 length:531 start_codon:yes stop_codon:yes gene_type:complete
MALRLEEKQAIVAEVNEAAGAALSAVVSDYRGLTVSQMTALRVKARESGVYLKVIRNTLARRAVAGTDYECLNDAFVGPTLLAFSQEDPGAAARLIKDYAKEHEALKVRALSLGGQLYGAEDIDRLAKLPTLDEARSLLMAVMQAPIAKLVRTFNDVPGRVVRVVAAVRDQKQDAA